MKRLTSITKLIIFVGTLAAGSNLQAATRRNMNSHNWIRALLVVAIGPSGAFLVHADEPGSIEYTLTQPGKVSAAVYDSGGRLVRTLLSGAAQNKGAHRLTWDGLAATANRCQSAITSGRCFARRAFAPNT